MVKTLFLTKKKDKIKETANNKNLLSKKRTEPDAPRNDIDMVKLKRKINEIMDDICTKNSNDNNNYLYSSMYKNYLLNEFTSNCLNYINKMITDVEKNHLKKFQGKFELNKTFISIIKELLMNEFELLLLSLYLESIDITLYKEDFSFEESLIFLCYFIKKLTLFPEKLSPINSFLIRKYQGFQDKYNKWFQLNSMVFNNKLFFSYIEINQRFKEYNIPYSVYCKNNYIDYNLIIDRILTMSIPYNDCKNKINIIGDKKDNSNNSIIGNNNINDNFQSIKNRNEINNISNEIFLTVKNYDKFNYNIKNNNNLFTSNYISSLPTDIFLSSNNNFDINLGCLYNRSNIISNKNNKINNNELIAPQLINNEFIPIKANESKTNTAFKINNLNNFSNLLINSKIYLNDKENSNIIKNKDLFKQVGDMQKNDKINCDDENNIKNKNILINGEQSNKKEVSMTPINLLYSLNNETNNYINPNMNIDNYNLIQKMYNQIKNDDNNINTKLIKNNDRVDIIQPQNNIINYNNYLQMNDFNALKYNINLGINEYNTSGQISLFPTSNPYFMSNNFLYRSSFNGTEQDDNIKLFQSNENLYKYNITNSSKNLYQINNILNSGNNNNNINNENINSNCSEINQFMQNKNPLLNINNDNYGINNIIQEKNDEKNKQN